MGQNFPIILQIRHMRLSTLFILIFAFPKREAEIKTQHLQFPWMVLLEVLTGGLQKSSKRKQRLYKKFLKKKKTTENETIHLFFFISIATIRILRLKFFKKLSIL